MHYPLGFLGDEVELLTQQQNSTLASVAVLVQAAGMSLLAKEGGKHFNKLLKRLTGD